MMMGEVRRFGRGEEEGRILRKPDFPVEEDFAPFDRMDGDFLMTAFDFESLEEVFSLFHCKECAFFRETGNDEKSKYAKYHTKKSFDDENPVEH
jgi:hypothetical protein